MLVSLWQERAGEKVIVYFLTCAAVDFYALALPLVAPEKAGIGVRALHGRMKQAQRQATLAAFAKAPSGAAVCPWCSTFLIIFQYREASTTIFRTFKDMVQKASTPFGCAPCDAARIQAG